MPFLIRIQFRKDRVLCGSVAARKENRVCARLNSPTGNLFPDRNAFPCCRFFEELPYIVIETCCLLFAISIQFGNDGIFPDLTRRAGDRPCKGSGIGIHTVNYLADRIRLVDVEDVLEIPG